MMDNLGHHERNTKSAHVQDATLMKANQSQPEATEGYRIFSQSETLHGMPVSQDRQSNHIGNAHSL